MDTTNHEYGNQSSFEKRAASHGHFNFSASKWLKNHNKRDK